MTVRVTDVDHGYDALVRDMRKLRSSRVLVGILQDKGGETDEDGGITLAGYAAVNEFGSEDGRVPERSFLRSTMDTNKAAYADELKAALGSAVDRVVKGSAGDMLKEMERGLGRLGLKAVRDVKDTIRDLRDPPNAPSTLERKYPGENPLIDTGRMRASIDHKVEMSVRR